MSLSQHMLKDAESLFSQSVNMDFAQLLESIKDRIPPLMRGKFPADMQDYIALLAMADSPERNLLIAKTHRIPTFRDALKHLCQYGLCVEMTFVFVGEGVQVNGVRIKAVCDV